MNKYIWIGIGVFAIILIVIFIVNKNTSTPTIPLDNWYNNNNPINPSNPSNPIVSTNLTGNWINTTINDMVKITDDGTNLTFSEGTKPTITGKWITTSSISAVDVNGKSITGILSDNDSTLTFQQDTPAIWKKIVLAGNYTTTMPVPGIKASITISGNNLNIVMNNVSSPITWNKDGTLTYGQLTGTISFISDFLYITWTGVSPPLVWKKD